MRRAFAVLVIAAGALGQQPPPFRAETRVVQVPVTVTSAAGKEVEGLSARDFALRDDAAAREIALDVFGPGAAPISLVIAFETTAAAGTALAKIRRGGALVQPLVTGRRGEAAVMTFDSEVVWRLDFTSDRDLIRRAVAGVNARDETRGRMLDAVTEACVRLKDRAGRKVLLLVSESRDRGSSVKLDEAIRAVEREGVEVFAAPFSVYGTSFTSKSEELPPPSGANYLAVFRELSRLGKTNHVDALAQASGGSVYPFTRQRAAEKAIENLGAEVHSQYILSFAPGAVRPGMHEIVVSLPGKPALRVRSRQAYWAD